MWLMNYGQVGVIIMAKYISADELITNFDTMKNPDSEFATDDYIDGFSDGVSAAIKELKTMSTTDVVEVVRCKDCKYAHYWYGNDDLGNTKYLCHYIEYDNFYPDVFADDFCSYGERKELK